MELNPTPPADAYVSRERIDEEQETYPLDLLLCHDCSLLQIPDVIDPEVLYGQYLYKTVTSPGLVEHFREYSQDVINRINPPRGSSVVEIGSNDGTLLKFFQSQGMRVLGIDPAQDIAKKVTEGGVETLPVFFSVDLAREIKNERGPTIIIVANNVIANIDNLDELMEGVRNLLAPQGVFIFETGYLVGILENLVFDNVYHEHLCYYSVKALDSFFKQKGMELIDVKRVPTKGGSLRGIVQFAGGRHTLAPSVKELIELETKLGVDRVETYKDFAAKIDSEKEKLHKLLKDLRDQGKTIAGYGASHSVTTFIYYFGIGEILDFLIDDNFLKQNTFSPGYHIPVFSSQEIYKRKPDYILILAWRFHEPITKKHQTFLKQGGHFILPLPEVKVV